MRSLKIIPRRFTIAIVVVISTSLSVAYAASLGLSSRTQAHGLSCVASVETRRHKLPRVARTSNEASKRDG